MSASLLPRRLVLCARRRRTQLSPAFSHSSSSRILRSFATASSSAQQPPSATPSLATDLQAGAVLHGFQVQRVQRVPEFDLTAVQLKHQKTGAHYMHVFKDDTNNVFNVGFHTPVTDSTGVPHILEHTTLCGSERYPVRDPFFKMLNRSMSTFMNALTGNDYTMYPFSTQNPVDFQNLMDVYLDSTFAPKLRELDFKQEGWRLEHQKHDDPNSPLIFKGVVYNEMKGALSDLGSLFYTRSQQHLYPGGTNSHVSGGDPENITDLTHQQLLDFHATHYHPSNARFFTYGSFPLESHLKAIDARISKFEPITLKKDAETVRFDSPKLVRATCPSDSLADADKQTKMSVSFLTNEQLDSTETFAVGVLTSLLLDGAAAPMYKALIETNIGSDYAVTTGYSQEARITSVAFGLQGIRSADVQKVEDIVMRVLNQAAQTGFDPARVESVIHQTELGLKHRTASFGMSIGQQVMSNWVHGGDPIEFLKVSERIEKIRADITRPRFFEGMIEKYFLKNKHRLVFVMEPDEEYSAKLHANEERRLAEKVQALTEADKAKIFEDGIQLAKSQEAKEDISCLPTLTIADIPAEGATYPVRTSLQGGIPVQWRSTATNGVSYVSIAKNVDAMPKHLKPFMPLYANALGSLNTRNHDLPVLDEAIRKHTGGISTSITSHSSPTSLDTEHTTLTFSSNSLDKNVPAMYHLIGEVAAQTKWTDLERLRTVVLTAANDASQSVVQNGHRFAMRAASSGLARSANTTETLAGLEQVKFLGALARNGVEGIESIAEKLREISDLVAGSNALTKASVVSETTAQPAHTRALDGLVSSLGWKAPSADVLAMQAAAEAFMPTFGNTFHALPLAVNFTSRTFLGVPYTHPDSPALQLLCSLLTHHNLHREIREKGGAYGAGAAYSPIDGGTISLWSYRDPPAGLARTLDAYDGAVRWASQGFPGGNVGGRELDEAKLSAFQGVDRPVSASEEGQGGFRLGITDEMRQERRERLVGCGLDQVVDVARRYLGDGKSAVAVLGAREDGEKLVAEDAGKWTLSG
ncbi:Mitochondrial presequence protease [Thoreauomyces humboldtii]|nr:Mitochondrial presequence protease [Thoreauomyces humboldtii]